MAEKTLPSEEFHALMEGFASGSEEAALRITEMYSPHILKVVRAALPALIRPKLDSVDFTQAVWASLLIERKNLSRVESPQQLVGLLAATARHKVIDAYRHYTDTAARNVRRELPIDNGPASSNGDESIDLEPAGRDPSPSEVAGARERWQQIIDSSSQRDRRILALRLEGHTCGEVAEQLDISSATVRRTLDRLIRELRT